MFKRTKILCTLGPASESAEVVSEMVKAGMNAVRLNFSHGTHEQHARLISQVRKIEKETDEPIAIVADLQGPKIRVGLLPEKGLDLKIGEIVNLNTSLIDYQNGVLPVNFSNLSVALKEGERMLLDDGQIELKIIQH